MATYNAEIGVKVVGLGQLKTLEAALGRITRLQQQIQKAVNVKVATSVAERSLDRMTAAAARLDTTLQNTSKRGVRLDLRGVNADIREVQRQISGLNRTVKVRSEFTSSGNNSAGGGNGGSALAAILSAQSLASVKSLHAMVQKMPQSVAEGTAAIARQEDQWAEINQQLRQVRAAEAELNNEIARRGGLATTAQRIQRSALRETRSELKNQLADERARLTVLDQQTAALKQQASVAARVSAQRRADAPIAGRPVGGAGGFARGAGAGLAFSNLPGSQLAQTIGAGAIAGGKAGAVGAAVGATTVALTAGAGATAKYAAEIAKMQVALQGVTRSSQDYAFALGAINRASADYLIPIQDATAAYTRLTAAADSAGFGAKETETIFRGLAAANTALGGDTEKLNGILLATSQVLSKGKVAAEELRGQIGERLPGAVSEFAKATGRTTQELDKALEQGQVSLRDFYNFSKALLDKYDKNAQKIATGPENAGARLEQALANLSNNVGKLLAPIGAAFQDAFTKVVTWVDTGIQALQRFFNWIAFNGSDGGPGRIKALETQLTALKAIDAKLNKDKLSGTPYASSNRSLIKQKQQELTRLKGLQQPSAPAVSTALPPANPAPTAGAGAEKAKGPAYPAYISQRQFADFMATKGFRWNQGMGGHKTPNHDRNAMDFGYWGKNPDYVAATKEWETKLRATGAFGSQLFGPINDWYGHGEGRKKGNTHIHAPSPGGMVKVNDGLASLMGFKGAGQDGAYDLAAGILEEQQRQLELLTESQAKGDEMKLQLQDRVRGLGTVNETMQGILQSETDYRDLQIEINALLDQKQQKDLTALNTKARDLEIQQTVAALSKGELAATLEQQALLEASRGRLNELVAGGMLQSLAEEIVRIEAIYALDLQRVEAALTQQKLKIEQLKAEGATATELQRQLDILRDMEKVKAGLGGMKAVATGTAAAANSPQQRMQDAYTAAKAELTALADPTNQAIAGAQALGDAFATSFRGIVSGSMTAQEALAAFFQNTAQHFIDMATQMIAKAMILKVLGILGGAAGGGGLGSTFSGNSTLSSGFSGTGSAVGGWSFAGGGYTGDAPRSGGVDGEGGFPAILHPQETVIDHTRAMDRYRPVSAGSAADGGESGAAESGPGLSLSMSFQTTRFMDRDWVDQEQLQVAMAQAAKQGAAGGHGRVMSDLRHKRSSRARLGMAG